MIRRGLLLAAGLWLAACSPATAPSDGSVLVVGDSIMAWNGPASVGDALDEALPTRRVVSRARSGARFASQSGLARATGFDVRSQYAPGGWDWVVADGGANDLLSRCGCRSCDAELDALIAPDSRSGLWPDFVARVRGDGARLVIMGYYGPSGRGGGFDICNDELTEMDARLARLAAGDPGVVFVDSGEAVGRQTPDFYGPDNVHPTAAGSAAIAGLLADAIRDAR